jgi:hypothetical protein
MKKYKNDLIRQVHDYFALAIHEAAKIDGNSATFDQTKDVLDFGRASGLDDDEIKVITNLKHAYQNAISMANDSTWKYDYKDVIYINRLVGLDLIPGSSVFRYKDVTVGNIYHPPFPPTPEIWKEEIQNVLQAQLNIEAILYLFGYMTKQQIFNNGNKRTALVFCNSLLISAEIGFINVPVQSKNEFSKLLTSFYTDKIDEQTFINSMKNK